MSGCVRGLFCNLRSFRGFCSAGSARPVVPLSPWSWSIPPPWTHARTHVNTPCVVNAIVSTQIVKDGTPASVIPLAIFGTAFFVGTLYVSLDTALKWTSSPFGLCIVNHPLSSSRRSDSVTALRPLVQAAARSLCTLSGDIILLKSRLEVCNARLDEVASSNLSSCALGDVCSSAAHGTGYPSFHDAHPTPSDLLSRYLLVQIAHVQGSYPTALLRDDAPRYVRLCTRSPDVSAATTLAMSDTVY
ncbi:hypothetical protein BKA62DRAFT_785651 [Auriculariales sp. MPI-PUGE-AT-0066]|nr:hypothetical protein BKA62DRAFT_785651 [Auriculariales sp. MPI-PUGE-AT-0066]